MNIFKRIWHKFNLYGKWKKFLILFSLFLLLVYLFSIPKPLFDTPYSTIVTDKDGELLGARIAADGQWRFPPADSVSEKYRLCLIRYEDKGFRYHPGVNLLSLGRAFYQNIQSGRVVSGGSTITMQTVRLMRGNKRTYIEKLIEIIIATRLELSLSKRKIINLYASHAPMGGNVVGTDAAAWRYFGHDAASLSWAEAATLAVLPNSPALIHPGKNREALLQKRNRLLKKMHQDGFIADIDYQLAIEEPLPPNTFPLPQIAPHLVSLFHQQYPGKQVESTINKDLQLQAEDVLARWNREFAQNGVNNIAALIVDLKDNEVISYMGNVNFDSPQSGNQVDVIHASRSTGSVLKPFLYAAMLQDGELLPTELLPDIPVNIGGFSPKNFSLQYDGAVHADEALVRSLNVPFVVSLRKYGVPKFHDLLRKSGFSTLNKPSDHYGLSLILGGAEGSLWDVATLYAGMLHSLNEEGKKSFKQFGLSEKHPIKQREITQNFDPAASWITLEALTNVNRPEEIDWQFIPSMRKIAWKTGTSFGFRDGWAVGVTPKYMVAVWTGNAGGEGRPGLTGARTSARVMFDLFNLLPATGWFDPPFGSLTEVEICRESGCLAGKDCPVEVLDTILAPLKAQYGTVCPYHRVVHLSEDKRYRVYEDCAAERGIVKASWFVLPPSWEWYYRQHRTEYRQLPPFAPECIGSGSENVMQFIYPHKNAVIKLATQLDGSKGVAVFELAHQNVSAKVFWHLDEEYLGETTDIHQMELSPKPGEHLITVVDDKGNEERIRFRVE